jgi:hypothetical protein
VSFSRRFSLPTGAGKEGKAKALLCDRDFLEVSDFKLHVSQPENLWRDGDFGEIDDFKLHVSSSGAQV